MPGQLCNYLPSVFLFWNDFSLFYLVILDNYSFIMLRMGIFPACMSVHYLLPGASGGQKRVLDPLDPELGML